MNTEKAALLFEGWEETLIWSCLQGCMGDLRCDNYDNPRSVVIELGDFCFFAGIPDDNLFSGIDGFMLLIPQSEAWEKAIEMHYGERATRSLRYAIKKEPDIFNREMLVRYANNIDKDYELKLFDREIYEMASSQPWSSDLCGQFVDYGDYKERGLGAAILHDGKLVSGASSYTVYNGGIEIEIDTVREYRERGLATVCAARLIIECLDRGLYPSWDAHDLRSVALAQKLGYHLDKPYVTYCIQ